MTDDETTDAELAAMVCAKDYELGQRVRARLKALRLRCVVSPTPPQTRPELAELGQTVSEGLAV